MFPEPTPQLSLQIGGIGIRLTGDLQPEFTFTGKFPDFYLNTPAKAEYQVITAPVPSQPEGVPAFDSGQGWRLYFDGPRPVIWARSMHRNPHLAGWFSPDFHHGRIYVSESHDTPGRRVFPLASPLGGILMTSLLGRGYGVMLHSCGVVDQDAGLVFAGISGNGKSTTARLWQGQPGVSILNDDHTIIRKIDGTFRVFGTPWHGVGGMALAADAPLARLFILRHAPANHAVQLSPSRAAAALLVRTFAPLWDAAAMQFTLAFLADLCTSLPVYELGFVPQPSAVDYVRCLPAL